MSVFKRGTKYWVHFGFDGRRYRKPSPDNSLAGAKVYESLLRQKLSRGESVEADRPEKKEDVSTFKEFSKKWFDVYVKTNNKYSEMLNKESILRAHLNPFFGNKQLDKINNLDIESYKSKKLLDGQSAKSVNNHLIVLNKCFKTAQEWEVIHEIPKIKLLKVQPQKFDFLSIEECRILLNNCDGMLEEMVRVGLRSGLRFGELIALQWSDIDFKGRFMIIQRSISRGRMGSTKSNKIRYIPLSVDIFQILDSRVKKEGFVFSKNGEPLGPVLCLDWLHKACERAGMRKIGWHTLRHTFASHLAQNSVSILLVKELLGHADVKTTMRYAHLTASATRGAIDTLNKDIRHNNDTILNIGECKSIALIPEGTRIVQKFQ